MPPYLYIFRLDGPIIDVSESVPSAGRRTVQTYFGRFLGVRGSGTLVPLEAVQQFRAAGFDEPRTLSAALIRYALSLLPGTFHPPRRPARSSAEAAAFLRRAGEPLRDVTFDDLRERADWPGVAAQIRAAGGSREGVTQVLGSWRHPLLLDRGELDGNDLVGRLYREIYLGQRNFGRLEGMYPRFHRAPGLIETEKLAVNQQRLDQLRHRYRGRLAALTTRSEAEARRVMEMLNIGSLFDALVTREDVVAEEARQQRLGAAVGALLPHPFMVLEAAARLDPGGHRSAAYVGASVRDVQAARAAHEVGGRRLAPWAVVPPGAGATRAALEAAGAVQLFATTEALVTALLDVDS